jgi:hypothetical protein
VTTVFCEDYDITMQKEDGDEFKLYLREIMNKADTSEIEAVHRACYRR